MASGDNRWLKVGEHDTVILSSHAIPGNEFNVNRVIDGLLRNGAEVIHSGVADVHATGHAQADELKTLLSITRPECFVPIHGEYRHMVAHAKLGRRHGRAGTEHRALRGRRRHHACPTRAWRSTGRVPAGYLYVDGIVGDVGQGVLRDRRVLAEEGVVVVVATVDVSASKVLTGPEIITRGWVYAPEAEDAAGRGVRPGGRGGRAGAANGVRDVEGLEREVRRAAGQFVSERTTRRPMIVPVVMEA